MPLTLDAHDYDMLLKDDDDRPPEIIITSAGKSKSGDMEFQLKSDKELNEILTKAKSNLLTLGDKLRDNGEKLRERIRRCENEVERRNKLNTNKDKGGTRRQETLEWSDLSDDGTVCRKETSDKNSLASSKFANLFTKKMGQDKNNSRTVHAFQNDLYFMSPYKAKKIKKSNQVSSRGQSKLMFSSRPKQITCMVDSMKNIISNGANKVNSFATTSSQDFYSHIRKNLSPPKQPSTKSRPKLKSSYNLMDEDDDEDDESLLWKPHVEKLSDCYKDVKVYYPSKDDRDPIEVSYTDMACLTSEAWLSSVIMNFYTRYLQQQLTSSSGNMISNYHFFNTYFYTNLQKLDYKGDSFVKFRKWWKRVNIFEKAYIFIPIHQSAHWSLVIICIPNKEEESGPIILHMDSLGLHNSISIFDNIRSFVKEEWSYLRSKEDPLDLSFTDEVWESLDDKITDKRVQAPRQKNANDCGLFVLYYMELFLKEAPERLTEKDLSMFNKQWFRPEEASNLRGTINNLLLKEFKDAKEKEAATLSPKC